ncbi:MAG: chorismate-binding protein [Tunicatimonas sp.]
MKNVLRDGEHRHNKSSAEAEVPVGDALPFSVVQRAFFSYAHARQRPVAAWRLPEQEQQHVIIDQYGSGQLPPFPLELLPAGFVTHPFSEHKQPSFVRADAHYTTGAPLTQDANQKALRLVEDYTEAKSHSPTPYEVSPTLPSPNTKRRSFISAVAEAVRAIEAGRLHKVVPSRQKSIALPTDFDLTEAFQRLCAAYPSAFVSVFSIPGVGTWLGASPETLVSTYQQGGQSVFRTMALAGTQVAQGQNPLKHASWRQKEIEEQAMVSRYIINCFKKIRLREFEESGPKTVAAGNLLHLRTDFTVDTEATNFPDLGSTMLRLLHPTSAVCGMPKEPALAFLREHEHYDRSFFSGYLGPVNVAEASHIFVNLRCAQLLEQRALLYAGAGVTADSEPEKEWQETELKMNTLLHVIAETN